MRVLTCDLSVHFTSISFESHYTFIQHKTETFKMTQKSLKKSISKGKVKR